MTNDRFLVIGATGNIGRHVVAGLHARGAAVRALSRGPATGFPDGVEVVTGDLTRPETLPPALSGVTGVFLLWPFLTADGSDKVAAVVAEHARHAVFVSAQHVRDDRPPAENGVWGQVEDAVRTAGLTWTFLRASGFATNALQWAPAVRAGDPVAIPYPKAARSLIHERDIADVAVLALTEDGHAGRAYVLTGPATITQEEQVRVMGEVAGRPATVEELTREQAHANLLAWADEAYAATALDYWRSLVDTPEVVTSTVRELTGRPARTFEQWARDHAAELRAG